MEAMMISMTMANGKMGDMPVGEKFCMETSLSISGSMNFMLHEMYYFSGLLFVDLLLSLQIVPSVGHSVVHASFEKPGKNILPVEFHLFFG